MSDSYTQQRHVCFIKHLIYAKDKKRVGSGEADANSTSDRTSSWEALRAT